MMHERDSDLVERLPCRLSAGEKERKADELTRELDQLAELKARKADATRLYGAEIKAADKRVYELSLQVRTGIEHRAVRVAERRLFERNLVEIFRVDTGEIVRTRALEAGERQEELFKAHDRAMRAGPGEDEDEEDPEDVRAH